MNDTIDKSKYKENIRIILIWLAIFIYITIVYILFAAGKKTYNRGVLVNNNKATVIIHE